MSYMYGTSSEPTLKSSRLRLRLTRIFVLSVLAMLCLGNTNWIAHPLLEQSLFFIGIALAGFGAAGRAWATSYIAGLKMKRLVVTGPYSLCRNPLYFFSLMLSLGIGFCTKTMTIPAIVAIVMAVLYYQQIKYEERGLLQRFGADYEQYLTTVPRFFPRNSHFQEADKVAISPRPLRAGLFGIAFLLILIGILELLHALHQAGFLPELFRIY